MLQFALIISTLFLTVPACNLTVKRLTLRKVIQNKTQSTTAGLSANIRLTIVSVFIFSVPPLDLSPFDPFSASLSLPSTH
jgi:hypothetical protein